jgi:5-formyltetrahydrofolate cyclo-ligase
MSDKEIKNQLRTRYRHERHERYVPHTFTHLLSTPELIGAQTIASYISYGDEPSTKELNAGILKAGKNLLLPRINGQNLDWVFWSGDEKQLKVNKKISEPIGEAVQAIDEIDLIVVPALRIDRSGYRLGQGGGYYDRALPSIRAWRIGLIHPDEISGSDLPREPHDIALNAAATPDLVLRFKS